MLSMTGYGKGEYKQNGLEITCEIKTVNNRYLDVALKAPRTFMGVEEVIRSKVREKMTRGHADVFVSVKDKREKAVSFTLDTALAKGYVDVAKTLHEQFPHLVNDFTIQSLLRAPDVLKQEDALGADEEMIQGLFEALDGALLSGNAATSGAGGGFYNFAHTFGNGGNGIDYRAAEFFGKELGIDYGFFFLVDIALIKSHYHRDTKLEKLSGKE